MPNEQTITNLVLNQVDSRETYEAMLEQGLVNEDEFYLIEEDEGSGGGSVVVDSELSETSNNPVENKVITAALAEKAPIVSPVFEESIALGEPLFLNGSHNVSLGYKGAIGGKVYNVVSQDNDNKTVTIDPSYYISSDFSVGSSIYLIPFLVAQQPIACNITAFDSATYTVTVDNEFSVTIKRIFFPLEDYVRKYSTVEGFHCTATGNYTHAEGIKTWANANASHAEGYQTTANGMYSHAEGNQTIAKSLNSHAEGFKSQALMGSAHAEGYHTIANGNRSGVHSQGAYNIDQGSSGTLIHIIGNGTAEDKRSNAHTLDFSGEAWFQGDVYVGSTSGTNKDEGSKKLATEEYADSKAVPATTANDNGKFLMVVDGVAAWATVPNAEEASF